MENEITRDRSPKSPKSSLFDAIEKVREVHKKAGKAPLSREVLASALGYAGLTGSSLTAIATLRQYGLLDTNGSLLSVSPLALRLLHPVNADQELKSRREAALLPPIFAELNESGFHIAEEGIIANRLVQGGFSAESAKLIARIFKENIEFAKLADPSNVSSGLEVFENDNPPAETNVRKPILTFENLPSGQVAPAASSVIAIYSIPLGDNEATLTFKGKQELATYHFDALLDYVELFKKQFERKQKSDQKAGIKNDGGVIEA